MMATEKDKAPKLDQFTATLKIEIREWLAANDVKQQELASRLGVTPSAVSANLRSNHTMTEGFVRRLSNAIPHFSQAIFTYFELKSSQPLPREMQGVIANRKSKAKQISHLRETEKEVIAAIRALTEAAVEAVEGE